jgi:hypothetical protein
MSFFARLFGRPKKEEALAEEAAGPTPTAEAPAPAPAAGKAPPAPAAKSAATATAAAPVKSEGGVKTEDAPKPTPAKTSAPAAASAPAKSSAPIPPAAKSNPAASAPAPAPAKTGGPAAAPAKAPSPTAPAGKSGDEVLDEVLGNLDASFNAIFDEKAHGKDGRTEDSDRTAMLELFYEIAANHLKPVRNFMTELSMGDARREWVAIARPAVESILSAAQQIGIPELEKRLHGFAETFAHVDGSTAFMISGELRQTFLSQYQRLASYMPKAFALDNGRDRNESLLTHSLLLQIPDVRKVTIDKLYRAGLSAMEVLFLATRDDLAATTGVRSVLAERIVEKFQGYRRTSQAPTSRDKKAARASELGKLAGLIGELKKQHQSFENAPATMSDAQKRGLRLSRQATILDITVVLAELGEADLVTQLEKLPFEHKIQRLEAYLKTNPT